MRNDDSYEAYKRKFNLGVVGVIILMLVLWFGNLMVRTTIGSYWLKI